MDLRATQLGYHPPKKPWSPFLGQSQHCYKGPNLYLIEQDMDPSHP